MWRLQPRLLHNFLNLFNNLTETIWGFFLISTFIHVLFFLPFLFFKQTGLIIVDSGNLPVYYGAQAPGFSSKSSSNFNSKFAGKDSLGARPECSTKRQRSRMYRMGATQKIKNILENSKESKSTNSFVKLGNKSSKSSLSKKNKLKNKKNVPYR